MYYETHDQFSKRADRTISRSTEKRMEPTAPLSVSFGAPAGVEYDFSGTISRWVSHVQRWLNPKP